MIEIILIIFSGIAIGVLLRGKRMAFLPKLIVVTIYLLLLLLGLSVGSNPQITSSLSTLGVKAFVITIFAVMGSILFTTLVYRYFFRGRGL